jgi:DNA-binding PadR family transcriptional regulator
VSRQDFEFGGGRSNDPTLLILTSLSAGPKHGHALLLDIEAFAGVRLGPGTLYGAITRLEQRGLIEPLGSDDRRRPYRITTAGSESLAATLADLRRIVDEATARLERQPIPATTPPSLVAARLVAR